MDLSTSLSSFKNQSLEQQLDWANTRLPPIVAVILVLLIAWKLADVTWLLAGSAPEPEVIPPVKTKAGAQVAADASNFNTSLVANANLFGAYQEPKPGEPVDAGPVVETSLPLTLFGTAASDNNQEAFALIEANGNTKAYFVDDTIQGGAKLHSVHPDHVILKRGVALERLERKSLADSKGTGTSRRRVASRRRTASPTPTQSGDLSSLRQELVNNPAKFTDIVRPTPIYNNGKLAGYRVYPGRERQKFIEIGLKPGDLVTAINSTTLDDPAQGAKIFRELATASSVNLTVERAGQSMNITVNLGG